MINWEELKENNTLEDFYNILCRNKPHRNSKKYKEWDYLECNEIIDSIIEYLKKEKMEVLKNYDL